MALEENEKKGFDGLGDLVSDITKELETPVARVESPNSSSTSNPNNPSATQQSKSNLSTDTEIETTGKSGDGRAWLWVLGVIVIGLIISNLPNSDKTVSNSPSSPDTAAVEVASQDAPTPYEQAAQDVAAPVDAFPEEMPPFGNGLVLSPNQIRYCFAEDVRLGAIKNNVDRYTHSEVQSFNSAINDYNARCGNFKYKVGSLESIRAEIETHRSNLVAEGESRLSSWRSKPAQPGYTPLPSESDSVLDSTADETAR